MKNASHNTALAVSATASTIQVVMPSPDMDSAGRVNYFNRVAKDAGSISVKAAFYAGLELMKVKANQGYGNFWNWVDANCEFSKKTAQNYIHTAFMYLEKKFDVDHLLETSDAERQKAVEETANDCGDKTLMDIYCDLGICKKTKSNLGGKREGAGRKPKELADAASAAEAADAPQFAVDNAQHAAVELFKEGVTNNGFAAMAVPTLNKIYNLLDDTMNAIDAELKRREANAK